LELFIGIKHDPLRGIINQAHRAAASSIVDSRTALAAFIVYLLLPEFWVGWKQA
jgi:hypothetical protein